MNDQTWDADFLNVWSAGVEAYRSGLRAPERMFDESALGFLTSIGYSAREMFDFVEDYASGEEPSAETALLIAAVRRDYFKVVQKGVPSGKTVAAGSLPPKPAELEGIVWLPRIIAKAKAKLRGELDEDTMYSCGGDRAFFARHGIHGADFLRVVWAAGEDEGKILEFVKSGLC